MPIVVPPIDTRRWEELRDELLARIPSHTPEWTNHGPGDPGVTLLELFAFLGESILYRANRIPERNRLAFLSLLGRPLHPGAPARALVTFERSAPASGTPTTSTLATGLELRAGKLAWHLDAGLDVLPVDSVVCTKASVPLTTTDAAQYRRLYASLLSGPSAPIAVYRTTPLGPDGLRFGDRTVTVDGCVWIALLARKGDSPTATRAALAGRVLSLGLAVDDRYDGVDLPVAGSVDEGSQPGFAAHLATGTGTTPTWTPLGVARGALRETGVVSFVLPAASQLVAWPAPEVLDQGVGDAPPALENASDADRLLVWLRLSPLGDPNVALRWIGINAATATQGDRVYTESVGVGDGAPDQEATVARTPVVPGSLQLWVGDEEWTILADVGAAPREGATGSTAATVDWEAGKIRFGSGLNGARPKRGAPIRVSYEVSAGDAGNVGAGAISAVAVTGMKVRNPVPAWGGTAAESIEDAERQVARTLQHNDRLVTVEDFAVLAQRTPGVDIARVDVLPAFHPLAGTSRPGDAPGCVTVMVVPPQRVSGEAPRPTDAALEAVCAWLEPRRLVTTEVLLRGPTYIDVHVSVGIELAVDLSGTSAAEVREAVRVALVNALSPVPTAAGPGWPLARKVRAQELFVVVANVPGVRAVTDVLLGTAAGTAGDVTLTGLQLPWLAAVAVVEGIPTPLSSLRPSGSTPTTGAALPLPAVPARCG